MFPESQYRPTDVKQAGIRGSIPETIRFDLFPPEFSVLFWPSRMLRATMPGTPINEDGDIQSRKGQICRTTRILQNLVVDPVTEAL